MKPEFETWYPPLPPDMVCSICSEPVIVTPNLRMGGYAARLVFCSSVCLFAWSDGEQAWWAHELEQQRQWRGRRGPGAPDIP